MSAMRTRWAAIGAAVAVTLGAGGISLGQAAIGSGDKPVFVAIEPCRLVDTRPGPANIGGRTAPLSAGDTLTLQITGSTGQCASIPTGATAAAMNVTAIQGSTRSFLTIYPEDADLPNASNLNWNGGDPPTPNKVDVALSPGGAVKITNNAGTVHVAADLVGYYTDHHHDDRYYTKSQTDSRYFSREQTNAALAGKADASSVYTRAQVDDLLIPDSILVPAAAFVAVSPWSHGGYFVDRPAGTNRCVYAPVNVPPATTVTSFELQYSSQPATVRVELSQVPFVDGFYEVLAVVTTGAVAVPGVGLNDFYADVVDLPVSGNQSPLPDAPQMLSVCTTAAMAVFGVKVNLQ